MPALRKISIQQARDVAARARIYPAVVRGTTTLRFSRLPMDPKLEAISWEQFERYARDRGVVVYEAGGWLRIMRDREA
jgi:hypothetical protein